MSSYNLLSEAKASVIVTFCIRTIVENFADRWIWQVFDMLRMKELAKHIGAGTVTTLPGLLHGSNTMLVKLHLVLAAVDGHWILTRLHEC